ncbi:MAG TPA: DUF177 domain-containing protein [Candidatus Omnitrophota bacterium]|nr:DUF177 domain-containing protein [Candidatus Omnitrophota bacterium]
MLKFTLSEFKEGVRVPVAGEYDPKQIEVEFPDLHYVAPVRLEGFAEKNAGTFRFEGTLTTRARKTCGRCLKEMESGFSEDFDWIYETENRETIDPADNVRELLIIGHELAYLCQENCKGLCPVCGKNLNENTCKCRQSSYHSFPVIKKLKPKKES